VANVVRCSIANHLRYVSELDRFNLRVHWLKKKKTSYGKIREFYLLFLHILYILCIISRLTIKIIPSKQYNNLINIIKHIHIEQRE
jgi:hypothetical protein